MLSSCVSGSDVTSATSHVLHSHVTPAATQTQTTWREERDACLLGNEVIILSSCQLKMRMLRFVVYSVLAVLFKGVISNQITFFKVNEAPLSAGRKAPDVLHLLATPLTVPLYSFFKPPQLMFERHFLFIGSSMK